MPIRFPSLVSFSDYLLRNDLEFMSEHVLGKPYSTVKSLIYPSPRYRSFAIEKRNGAPRKIQEPSKNIKDMQQKVLAFLEKISAKPKPCVHGFVKRRSIVTNARKHIDRRPYHLLNLDLENFFPSISFYRVRGILQNKPFDFSYAVATVIAHLCTRNNELPQGAPTSPFFSNLTCRSLDKDLMELAKRHRATYTRYADDLTFSFSTRDASRLPANICSFDSGELGLGHELQAIIETKHSFRINPSKSRISTRKHRMEVTGITVNEFPNVKRIFIDRIRGALNAWATHGYTAAQTGWESRIAAGAGIAYEKRPWKRQTRTRSTPQLKNVLWGKLLYLRMVRGKDDVIYTRLAEKYNRLCSQEKERDEEFQASSLPIEPIVRNAQDVEIATFVVEWAGDFKPSVEISEMVGGQGTAFAYKKHNMLITCDHVLRWQGMVTNKFTGDPLGEMATDYESTDIDAKTLLVKNPSLNKEWPIRVVHRDAARDLAILEFIGEVPKLRFFANTESAITRNSTGALIGFPNWHTGRKVDQIEAKVLNYYPRSGLARFEISRTIRKGNSGGPFVDDLYRVAGVAQQGATHDSGNDECLCVTDLEAWILEWKLSRPMAAPE